MRPARARESSRWGHSAGRDAADRRAGERQVDARDAAPAEVHGAAARAPRPAARGRRRSGGCRCGRRARGRAPGRGRCRSPRRCGARRRAGRRVQLRSRSSRPCVASAVSMWSRKPTPVATDERPLPSRATAHVDGRLARAPGRRAAPAPDAGSARAAARVGAGAAQQRGERLRRGGRSPAAWQIEARMTPSSSGSWPKLRTTSPRDASPANASSPIHGVRKVT